MHFTNLANPKNPNLNLDCTDFGCEIYLMLCKVYQWPVKILIIVMYSISLEKEIAKGGQMKESMERQYSKIAELEERFRHKMHVSKVSTTVRILHPFKLHLSLLCSCSAL